MNFKNDVKLEQTLKRAETYKDITSEACRRAAEDGYMRIVYMTTGASYGVRLVGVDKQLGDITLCLCRPDGKVIEKGETK